VTSEASHHAIRDVATVLATDPVHDEFDWTELALVVDRRPFEPTVYALSGYLYFANGEWTPTQISIDTVEPAFAALVSSMQFDEEDPGWVQCLFQIQRPSGKTRLFFEHENETRWAFNTADWDAFPLEIRPEFDKPAATTDAI